MVLTEEQKLCYKPTMTEGRQEDLVLLSDITAEAVATILRSRFDNDDMYTSIGPVLIAVNPYRLIMKGGQSIYSEDVTKHYYKSSPLEVVPHIFKIAGDAYKNMLEYGDSQAIIVTGESGAGKTETAKQLMKFMTLVCIDNDSSASSSSSGPVRRLTVSEEGSVTSLSGLSLTERIESQQSLSAKDRVVRGMADLVERESVNRKLRSRNVKSRNSKNILAALRPNAVDVELLRSSADNEMELREVFEGLCKEEDGEQFVSISDVSSMSEISELLEMGTITEEFLLEIARGVTGEVEAETPELLHLHFPQFKQALKLVEVEVQYVDDTRKTERRRAQSIFDYHHVAMDLLEESVPSMDGEDAVNPLQLMSLNDIRAQLLESNPVLEAFGNSQTIRNDNSSRFGKYLELQFNGTGNLLGGKVSTYLLEKARLVHQGEKESNFHVLHLLTQGSLEKDREQYLLEPPQAYHYLQYTDKKMRGDKQQLTLPMLKDSLKKIGIGNRMQSDIFQALSGILTLGNITFEDHGADEAATITNPDVLARCCMLLHIEPSPLEAAIVAHKLRQADNSTPLGPPGDGRSRRVTVAVRYHDMCEAAACRDTLAKELYNRLFLWIVNAINTNIEYRGPNKRTIGVLDIYGFEIFEDNHFEQFCINWVNEKLQQFFIEQTLRAEQLEYEVEKVEWTHIEYFDNKVVVDLIESKPGILSILDDQLSFKNCSAETFTSTIKSALGGNSNMISPDVYTRKNSDRTTFKFGIRHYAGDVCYNATYFIEKNTDALYEDVMKVMRSSKSSFVSELFADRRSDEEKSKRPPTIGVQFRKHLTDLVSTLRKCKPHYVRCIKPNDEKSPNFMDQARVIHQVQYLGIVENIKVRRAGYCYRSTFKDFVSHYRLLSTHTWPRWKPNACVEDCKSILNNTSPVQWKYSTPLETPQWKEGVDYKMGVTKVFIKDPTTLFVLEKNRTVALNAIVRTVQSAMRGYIALGRYRVIRRGFIKWQAEARCYLGKKHYAKKREDIIRFQAFSRRFIERCRYINLYNRFRGVPPRVYAQKIQALTRGFTFRSALSRTAPDVYEKLRSCMDNIRTSTQRTSAAVLLERIYRGYLARNLSAKRRLSRLRLRFYMKLKVRRVMAKKKWDKEYREAINTLRSTEGMTLIKCRHNGTSATEKTFRLVDDNILQWNTGLFSKTKLGIHMSGSTKVSKGGITYKRNVRQSVAINLKENPFKKSDPSANAAAIPSDQMDDLAITIANPPLHEVIIVSKTKEVRNKLYDVFHRFCSELTVSAIEEEKDEPFLPSPANDVTNADSPQFSPSNGEV
mmetsp:Transcript_15776/g.23714  ORF Transcript_15776/g.23714 Transcript_15776/m.23714 type:complete len:1310 (+) Transcript_15776:128-4057(+)